MHASLHRVNKGCCDFCYLFSYEALFTTATAFLNEQMGHSMTAMLIHCLYSTGTTAKNGWLLKPLGVHGYLSCNIAIFVTISSQGMCRVSIRKCLCIYDTPCDNYLTRESCSTYLWNTKTGYNATEWTTHTLVKTTNCIVTKVQ